MGMLGTVMNGLVIGDALETRGIDAKVLSSFEIAGICETSNHYNAREYIEDGKVAIFVGGMANPFFTTDTCAVLKAMQTECDAVFKGTGVDGIYSEDPKKSSSN